MALGNQLREARMRLGLTTSEIASATRMKVQIVDAIEREDFSPMAAPIYAKGFIKLFAERVGVDPAPLIDEYMEVHLHGAPAPADTKPASAPQAPPPAPPSPEPVVEEPAEPEEPDLFSLSERPARPAPAAAAPARPPEAAQRMRRIAHALAAGFQAGWTFVVVHAEKAATACRDGLPDLRAALRSIRFKDAPLKLVGVALGILVILVFIFSALSRYITAAPTESEQQGADLQLAIDPPEPYLE